MHRLPDFLLALAFFGGLSLVVVGIWLFSPPCALIVAGVMVAVVMSFLASGSGGKE